MSSSVRLCHEPVVFWLPRGYAFLIFYSKGAATQIRDDYKDLSDEEVIKKIHAKFKDKIDYSEIEGDYGRKLERFSSEKAKAVGIWLLVWLIPTLATYALGWSVGWVIRGFKPRKKVERMET